MSADRESDVKRYWVHDDGYWPEDDADVRTEMANEESEESFTLMVKASDYRAIQRQLEEARDERDKALIHEREYRALSLDMEQRWKTAESQKQELADGYKKVMTIGLQLKDERNQFRKQLEEAQGDKESMRQERNEWMSKYAQSERERDRLRQRVEELEKLVPDWETPEEYQALLKLQIHNLQSRLATSEAANGALKGALKAIRDNTFLDAEPPELRAQNEASHRVASQALKHAHALTDGGKESL